MDIVSVESLCPVDFLMVLSCDDFSQTFEIFDQIDFMVASFYIGNAERVSD